MKNYFLIVFLILTVILFSCASRRASVFIPVPDEEYFKTERIIVNTVDIVETKDGNTADNLPVWLSAFYNDGIEGVERISSYYNKYVFIGINEGVNFSALNIWANNYSAVRDFSILAAERIERRMISGSSLYPDNEFGIFFETMVKKAYSTVYPGAVKEDTYWVKIINEDYGISQLPAEIYNFYVLITIDKRTMQNIINNMMEEINSSIAPADLTAASAVTNAQRNSINRLQQTFFEGF